MFVLGRDYFAKSQWALLYLLIIVFVASVGGFRASFLAAVLAFFAWNFFFLPPFDTFVVHDPQDWLSLIVFLVVGITMGLQTSRMRSREQEALARERETALLNRLSANLVSISSTRTMADTILTEILTITGAQDAILFLADSTGQLQPLCPTHTTVCTTDPTTETFAQWVYRNNKAVGLPFITHLTELGVEGWPISARHQDVMPTGERHDLFLPLQTTTRTEGVLYIGERHNHAPYSAQDARLLVSINNLAAVFLERQRLEAAASKTEALREADRLKSTLVSSVSHELKTPLAAIKATVSNLLADDVELPPAVVHTELESVDANVERLSDSITGLLDLSRLQADAWESQRDWYEFGEIVADAVTALPTSARERITYAIPADLPPLFVDFQQWSRAVQHLMENALAYSTNGVRVGALSTPREIRLWIEDTGPGIPAEERERIFEKFYRGAASSQAPSGTGLGLAITAEIVRYHGGRIWIEEVQPHGARFVIALPREKEG